MLVALAGGLAAGAIVGAAIRAVETSRIAFGPYALYGNGAFAVPFVLSPLAIFVGWTLLAGRPGSAAIARTIFTLAVVVGVGIGYGVVMGDPSSVTGAVIGFGLFTIPSALVAGLTIGALRSRRVGADGRAVVGTFVLGALLAALPPFLYVGGLGVSGLSVGAGVVASERSTFAAATAVGVALLLLLLVQSFALPIVLGPLFGTR